MRALGLKNPIAIILNGVDLVPDAELAMDARQRNKTLLFLGRIHQKKGLKELLEAWNILRTKGALGDWSLKIAGWDDGGHLASLEQYVRQNGLRDSVHFLGPQFGHEKNRLFREVDGVRIALPERRTSNIGS